MCWSYYSCFSHVVSQSPSFWSKEHWIKLHKVAELLQEMCRVMVEADKKTFTLFDYKAETWDFRKESRENISLQDYSCTGISKVFSFVQALPQEQSKCHHLGVVKTGVNDVTSNHSLKNLLFIVFVWFFFFWECLLVIISVTLTLTHLEASALCWEL